MPKTDCKPLPSVSEKDIARFWSKVDKRGPDECWPWIGKRNRDGYGRLHISLREVGAHRVAHLVRSGADPFPFMVCHTCDVRYEPGDMSYRKCCNPAHLVVGTSADNLGHMAESGRCQSGDRHYSRRSPELMPRGENRAHSKLTEQDVIDIRYRYACRSESQTTLSREYGVNQTTISEIIRRKKWAHIP